MAGMGPGMWMQIAGNISERVGNLGYGIFNIIAAKKAAKELKKMGEPRYRPPDVSSEYYNILNRQEKRATEGIGSGTLLAQNQAMFRQALMNQQRAAVSGSPGIAGMYSAMAGNEMLRIGNENFLRNANAKLAAEQQANATLGTIAGIKQRGQEIKAQTDLQFNTQKYWFLVKTQAQAINNAFRHMFRALGPSKGHSQSGGIDQFGHIDKSGSAQNQGGDSEQQQQQQGNAKSGNISPEMMQMILNMIGSFGGKGGGFK